MRKPHIREISAPLVGTGHLIHPQSAGIPVPREPKPRKKIQSVERALNILEALAAAETDMKLSVIAKACGINTSTCHHLLSTLLSRGYVAQSPGERTYCLSNKVFELSQTRVKHIYLDEIAYPFLRELNEITKEATHLGMLQGGELTFLKGFECRFAVQVNSGTAGMSNAAHATSVGKVLLAWLSETEVARVIADKGLVKFTENTICTMAELFKDLEQTRRRGYSANHEELREGVVSFAAPVWDHTDTVIGAIACTTPAFRAVGEHRELIVESLISCARRLSDRLGADSASRRPCQT